MKKALLTFFILLLNCPTFATYKIIDENIDAKKYQEVVDKITPETLGLNPTIEDAEYAKDSDLINEHQISSNQTRYISEEKLNSVNLRGINDQKNDIPFIAKALGILIFGLLIAFIQWLWWFFTEYVPETQKKLINIKLHSSKKNNIIMNALKKIKTTNYYILGYIVILAFIYVNFISGLHNYGTIGYNDNISIYIILKWFVFLFAIWSMYIIHKENISSRLILLFIVISVLFNPIAQVHFDKEIWYWINNITALFFIWILFFRK